MPNAYDNLLHERWNMDKIIGRFDRVTPICSPGKCYGYQNIAFGLIQPAIEAIQNKSYAQLLQHRIFSPLKMDNASVGLSAFKANSTRAKPHVLLKVKKLANKRKRYTWGTAKATKDFYKVAPAAGVNASITDLGKWLIANLGHNPEVLSPLVLSELTTKRIKTTRELRKRHWRKLLKSTHYGYGWRIYQLQDFPIIFHSGWVEGFRANVGYAPDLGIGFAVLLNAESNAINKISSEFWRQAQKVI